MILSLAVNGFEPCLHALAWPVTPTRMGMDASVLVMASDGATLAIKYVESHQFARLITQKELDIAMMNLKAMSEWAYLVIGGYFRPVGNYKIEANGHESHMNSNALEGAKLSVQEHGISLLQIGKIDQLPDTVKMLAKRKRADKRIKPPRDALFMSPIEDLLMSLPGIGVEKATALLRHCGDSGAWALVALTDDEHNAPGVGEETRRKVREALGLADDMQFSVWVAEQKERAA